MDKEQMRYYRKLLEERLNGINNTIEMMKQNKSAEQDKYSPTELSTMTTTLLKWLRKYTRLK